MRLLVAVLLFSASPAIAQVAPTGELVRALLTLDGEEVDRVTVGPSLPSGHLADVLPGSATVMGSMVTRDRRGDDVTVVFVHLDDEPGSLVDGYRRAPPEGWVVDHLLERDGGSRASVELCSANGARAELRLAERPSGGTYAAVTEDPDGCGPNARLPASPPPPGPADPPVRLPRLSAPAGAEALNLESGYGRPTILRVGREATPEAVDTHLARVLEADGWAPLVRRETGGLRVSTWAESRPGYATTVVTLVVRRESDGTVRATAEQVD